GGGVALLRGQRMGGARGRVGEIESMVLVAVDGDGRPIAGRDREIACDAVCLAVGLVPSVELLHLVGARLRFDGTLGGWVPEVDASMRTSVPSVYAAGDCAGFCERMLGAPGVARAQGRVAGLAAAESLGVLGRREAEQRRGPVSPAMPPSADAFSYWQIWLRSLIEAGGWNVNACQCEEVTRRELVETRPPRYLGW